MILATPSGFRSRVVHQGDPLATVALRRLIRRYRRGAVSRGQRTFFGGVYGSSGPQRVRHAALGRQRWILVNITDRQRVYAQTVNRSSL